MTNPSSSTFRLPPPKFKDSIQQSLDNFSRHRNPHFSTPVGMLLPREKQPPPMFGPRGSTIPPCFLVNRRKRPGHAIRDTTARPPKNPHKAVEKDVKPELLLLNWNFWCQGCDVHCRSDMEYEQHLQNHKPCDMNGCKFVGHPMVMKRHHNKVHCKEKVQVSAVVQSSEEIGQWKAERRLRYPTKENVLLRQQAQEERFKRGERIEPDKSRFGNRPTNVTHHTGKHNPTKRKRNHCRNRGDYRVKNTTDQESSLRLPFKGTNSLAGYREPVRNALSMLGDYGTDDEVDEDNKETTTIMKKEETLSEGEIVEEEGQGSELVRDAIVTSASHGMSEKLTEEQNNVVTTAKKKVTDASKESSRVETTVPNCNKNRKNSNHSKHHRQHSSSKKPLEKPLLDYSKLHGAKQNTMLEKLLESDIRHERNVLLQCVRYVVASNFFGVGLSERCIQTEPKDDE